MKKIEEFTLVGVDGNAFSIMGYVSRAIMKSGLGTQKRLEYQEKAMKGDYDELLSVSIDTIDEINKLNGY